jgi:hypothetical protein
MERDLFSSLLAGTGAKCFDPRTNASGMALFDDKRRRKKAEGNAAEEEEEKGEHLAEGEALNAADDGRETKKKNRR